MKTLGLSILVAAVMMVTLPEAQAVPIAFTTTGTFSSPTGGCLVAAGNTITCDGYTLTFTSTATSQDVPLGFTSVVNFGQITVTGNSANEVVGGGSFTLQIVQTSPAPTGGSPLTFTGTLSADLINDASNSFLQFNAPFSQLVTATSAGVTYSLTEADDAVLGRSRISGSGEPPLDINGSVRPVAQGVPEPSSITLLGSGLFLLAFARLRINK